MDANVRVGAAEATVRQVVPTDELTPWNCPDGTVLDDAMKQQLIERFGSNAELVKMLQEQQVYVEVTTTDDGREARKFRGTQSRQASDEEIQTLLDNPGLDEEQLEAVRKVARERGLLP